MTKSVVDTVVRYPLITVSTFLASQNVLRTSCIVTQQTMSGNALMVILCFTTSATIRTKILTKIPQNIPQRFTTKIQWFLLLSHWFNVLMSNTVIWRTVNTIRKTMVLRTWE